MRRCCFTGHRPEKMTMTEKQVVKELEIAIRNAIDEELVAKTLQHVEVMYMQELEYEV